MANSINVNEIIKQMRQIIDSIVSTSLLSSGQSVDISVLRQAEKNLKNIEFRLQFELLKAEEEAELTGDFTLVDTLHDAIENCQDALNTDRAALIRGLVIGDDHKQIISYLQEIKNEISKAIASQQAFDFVIRLAGLVLRFVGA